MFLHIPKTGGTSVISAFCAHIAKSRTFNALEGDRSSWDTLTEKDFISGHLYFDEIMEIPFAQNCIKATVLRDPVKRLASHLKYQDQFSQPEFVELYSAWPDYVRAATDRLASVDFSCSKSLQSFFTDMSSWERLTFDNTQVRFFVENPGQGLNNFRPEITIDDVELAIERIRHFDLVGTTSNLDQFCSQLAGQAGIRGKVSVIRENANKCRRDIDLTDPTIVRVLRENVCGDQLLYEAARRGANYCR